MTTLRERCSIVIPACGCWDLTRKCLDSLTRTARGCEVIVVDNASADETPRKLERYGQGIRVVSLTENRHFAGGTNAGLRAASREFVVFLNNDTVASDGRWVDALISRLDEEQDVGAVGALLWYPGMPRRAQHAGMAVTSARQWLHLYRGMTAKDAPGILRGKDLQSVTGACMAMRRADALELGGFDEGYRSGYEDLDLCFNVRFTLGKRVTYEPRAQLVHREGQTPGRFAAELANAQRFAERWGHRVVVDHSRILGEDGGVRAFDYALGIRGG